MSQHAFLLALHPACSYLPDSLSCRPPDFTMSFWYYFVKLWKESNARPKSWRTEPLPPPSTPFLISLNMVSHVPDDLHSPSCTVRSAILTKHKIMPKHSMDKADIAPVPSFAGMVSLPRSLVPSSLRLSKVWRVPLAIRVCFPPKACFLPTLTWVQVGNPAPQHKKPTSNSSLLRFQERSKFPQRQSYKYD